MSVALPEYAPFTPKDHPDDTARWSTWFEGFDAMVGAMNVQEDCEASETDNRPASKQWYRLFIHYIGEDCRKLLKQLENNGAVNKDYAMAHTALTKHFSPALNRIYQLNVLSEQTQIAGESMDSFYHRVKEKIDAMKLTVLSKENIIELMTMSQLVNNCTDISAKRKAIKDNQSLKEFLASARAFERTEQQMKQMETRPVHVINKGGKSNSYKSTTKEPTNCGACGYAHLCGKCPARGQDCAKCGRKHHFAKVCRNQPKDRKHTFQRGKNVNSLDSSNSFPLAAADGDYSADNTYEEVLYCDLLHVGELSTGGKWEEHIKVEGRQILFKLDTGAQANTLPLRDLQKIHTQPMLSRTKVVLKPFGGGANIEPLGTIKLRCEVNGKQQRLLFYIVNTGSATTSAILGQDACEDLKLIQRINVNKLEAARGQSLTITDIVSQYSDNFSGCGKYDKPYHIELKPNIPPSIQPPRKIPYSKLENLRHALDELEKRQIIATVDKATDWVSNLVITEKKNGKMRLCLDPKQLNKAIKREHYNMPTPGDVQRDMSGKTIYTILDMADGFWHVQLDEDSSYLCTFNTPWGRKRFLRMPFGISSASEVMQKRNNETFGDIRGVHMVADDMIIAAASIEEHDQIIIKVMERAREKNVKFNKDKIQFKVTNVKYLGNILTPEGIKPDPQKVKAISDMPTPHDKAGLQRLLGMVKYLAQYIPNESQLTAPLRTLLKKDTQWQWLHEHDKAVENIRSALANSPVLGYYDVKKQVTVQADSSQSGLGACLLQDGQPIAYASRALSDAEKNYAQIEKELLAICYACTKFHQYIYGKSVNVQSDHRPLEAIFLKPIGATSPRLQRMLLKLQRYHLSVQYTPGKLMYVADTLSRAYLPEQADIKEQDFSDDIEVMVHSLVKEIDINATLADLPLTAIGTNKISEVASTDPVFIKLKSAILMGWPEHKSNADPDLSPFWAIRDQLHIAEGLLCYDSRILVPESMQQPILNLLHESHQGSSKTKARARQIIYWPGMNQQIDNMIMKCGICLKFRNDQIKEPMQPHIAPELAWQKVGSDIMNFKGKDYLVVVDYFSKYPELSPLKDKTASTIIMKLKSIFARHGIPGILMSDNMPYASSEFRTFAKEWGIELHTSSPLYPQSNGQAERFVQTLKRFLKKAYEEGKDFNLALLEYRNTPVTGLVHSPAQMLMSRSLRSKLPSTIKSLAPQVVHPREDLLDRQEKQKKLYDNRHSAQDLPPLSPGDVVRVKEGKTWEPAVVKEKHELPRSFIVNRDGRDYRRNRSQILKTEEAQPPAHISPEDEHDTSPTTLPEVERTLAAPPPQEPHTPVLCEPHPPVSPEPQRKSSRVSRAPKYLQDYYRK